MTENQEHIEKVENGLKMEELKAEIQMQVEKVKKKNYRDKYYKENKIDLINDAMKTEECVRCKEQVPSVHMKRHMKSNKCRSLENCLKALKENCDYINDKLGYICNFTLENA